MTAASQCHHDLAERESACADGICPICLAEQLRTQPPTSELPASGDCREEFEKWMRRQPTKVKFDFERDPARPDEYWSANVHWAWHGYQAALATRATSAATVQWDVIAELETLRRQISQSLYDDRPHHHVISVGAETVKEFEIALGNIITKLKSQNPPAEGVRGGGES